MSLSLPLPASSLLELRVILSIPKRQGFLVVTSCFCFCFVFCLSLFFHKSGNALNIFCKIKDSRFWLPHFCSWVPVVSAQTTTLNIWTFAAVVHCKLCLKVQCVEIRMICHQDRWWQKTRITSGVDFPRWKSLIRDEGFQSDSEVTCFLLDRCLLI